MIDVWLTEDGDVAVNAPARLAPIIGTLPTLKAKDNLWRGPLCPATLFAIATELAELPGFHPSDEITEEMSRYQSYRQFVHGRKAGEIPADVIHPDLYDYQRVGAAMLEEGPMLLGDEMGTGKTVMALTAARQLYKKRQAECFLVVAPNSMKFRWAEEAATWFPEAEAHVVHGTKAQRERRWMEMLESESDAPVVVIVNWESLRTLTKVAGYGSIKLTDDDHRPGILDAIEWDCVIADEAHRAKDPKAKQTRALWHISRSARWRWAMTGTPVLNTPGDLWSIGRFYDPESYGTSKYKWRDRYIDYIQTRFGQEDLGLRRDRTPEFTAWFDLRFLRRTKDEVLDLPDITYQTRTLEMSGKQGAAYRRMRDELLATVDGGLLIATDPLAHLTRLSQLASAMPTLDPDGGVCELVRPSNKIEALKDIIAEMGGRPLVVFAQSRKLIDLAESSLPEAITTMRITGAESAEQRALNVNRFQAGQIDVALCTLGAGSEGINLYAADTIVFLQRSYAFGMNQQAEARVHRNGQERPVTVIDLVSEGTVDELVIEALHSKGERAEEVLRDRARRGEL